jgi:GNAT superfamily N-acetyltransferase
MRMVSLAERPDLIDPMWNMPNLWPAFMLHDPYGTIFFDRLADVFPEFQFVAVGDDDAVIGKINSIPFQWHGHDDDLPDTGWDGIQQHGFDDHAHARTATAVSLLEARIAPQHQGRGLSRQLLEATRRRVQAMGINHLFGPVRPAAKSSQPATPMSEYVALVRTDGLPVDPWIRTHVRLGGRIVKVCPLSMTIPGTLSQWQEWTGARFTESGPTAVAGAISLVQVDIAQDYAVYVEANVWVHHALDHR